MSSHEILGGLVQVYKRGTGRFWQCSASVDGTQYRTTTKEEELQQAKQFAEDWFLGLRGKARAGLLENEKTFNDAADLFEKEYEVITEGQRSPRWVEGHKIRLRLHLRPFLGHLGISKITTAIAHDYRVHRATTPPKYSEEAKSFAKRWTPPSHSTIHDEIITLRLVLKSALRRGWIQYLPDLSAPYRKGAKVSRRPWFSPDEYKQLYTASREHSKKSLPHYRWNAEQVHDYILFMANTGLRPDEAAERNLEHRDVKVVHDPATEERILEIDLRGKRGIGFCKSMPGAVQPYLRLLKRAKPLPKDTDAEAQPAYPQPNDPVFPGNHIKLFNGILNRANLKTDRDGNKRTAYSLRHSYICMRLIEGADIYALAKNCRTSVEMIQKYYAAHIKDLLDTKAINKIREKPVRSAKPRRKTGRRNIPEHRPDI